MSDTLHFQMALTLAPKVGPVTAKTLVSYCGSAEAVFRASKREILKIPGIGPVVYNNLHVAGLLETAEMEVDWVVENKVSTCFYTDPTYPFRLKQNVDCPALLFFKGSDIELLNADRILGVVGTRQPTDMGKAHCEAFLEGLSGYGITMISGLAFGIDGTAHKKANKLKMPNLGVLGHGLGSIYPKEHHQIALQMTQNGGLITEYPHYTLPDREHFPMRNRIIAGMCDALLVVETAEMGGSMITADLAGQYNRDVFAIPGRLRDAKSAGCNLLIRQHKAQLTIAPEDLAETMNWEPLNAIKPVQAQLFPEIGSEENDILNQVKKNPEVGIDELSHSVALSPGRIASLLLELEFKGLVRTLPGKRYVAI